MKTVININEWINKNENSIGISLLLVIGFIFIISESEQKVYISLIPILVWLLHLVSKKLLGVEYKNKIKVFTPGRDKTIEQKLFLFFYVILALIAFIMIANKIKYGFIIFLIFIIISFAIGLIGSLIGFSKINFSEHNIKKIIVLDDKLIFYTNSKHTFKYEESRWKQKKHDEIIVYNKYDLAENIVIPLMNYKSVTKELILENIKSRIEKGLDIIY